jgi:FSR family fosmidomycin resistance protein-like MFS transporter
VTGSSAVSSIAAPATSSSARRTLLVSGVAHALHDGYTDLIYLLLPVWQSEFALSYAALATLRGLYAGTMAALQLPVERLGGRFSARAILALGTGLAALGYSLAGASGGLVGLCASLSLAGAGASTQHPIAASAVSRAYGANARGPLGVYNFAGDIGKAGLPAATSLLLMSMPWRHAIALIAAAGVVVAAAIFLAMPRVPAAAPVPAAAGTPRSGTGRRGFRLLFSIGVLDTATRMGLLTFLPFLLQAKGASLGQVGGALSLVFIGGAAGKFLCGWLGGRLGVLWTVLLTEGATAALILGVLALPLSATLITLPFLGLMLNGTSSVLYGTVPELAPPGRTERAFALFYTGTIGSGALSPVAYGLLGDAAGPQWGAAATALTALLTFPLAIALAPRLRS